MSPTTIAGRYVVERAVGHGGMGSVWLCRDEHLGRDVAVKEVGSLPGATASDLARAMREARSSAALNHPNVVSIYDAVEDGEHNWLVMEYVPSRTLSQVVAQDGPLSPERAAWIGAQAADGLSASHALGTMHRDVKPGNILVMDDDRVKITDFGIARTHGDAQLTRSGIVTGTPAYFAPELARGAEPTEAADVWALGATLYAAVEGRLPYPDQVNAIALLAQIASTPPPPPEQASFLGEPIARMMDHDPRTRWTMADVAHTLHRLHEEHRAPAGPGTVSFVAPAVLPTDEEGAAEPTDHATVDDGPATEATSAGDQTTEATASPAPPTPPSDEPGTTSEAQSETDAGTAPASEAPATPVHLSRHEVVPVPDSALAPPPPRPTAQPAPEERPAEEPVSTPQGQTRRSGRRLALAGAVLLVAVVAVVALELGGRDADDRAGSGDTSSSTSSGDESAGEGDADQPAPAEGVTDPEELVEAYYGLLPSDTETAWALLSSDLQDDIGGYGVYTGFWATIDEVSVDARRTVEEGVVDVDLTYSSDAGTESETRRLRVGEGENGLLVIGDRPV